MAICSTRPMRPPAADAASRRRVGGVTENALSSLVLPGLMRALVVKRCEETSAPSASRTNLYSHSTARTARRALLRTTALYLKPSTSLPSASTYQLVVSSQGLWTCLFQPWPSTSTAGRPSPPPGRHARAGDGPPPKAASSAAKAESFLNVLNIFPLFRRQGRSRTVWYVSNAGELSV